MTAQPSYAPPPLPAPPPSVLPAWARWIGLSCGALLLLGCCVGAVVAAVGISKGDGPFDSLPFGLAREAPPESMRPTPAASEEPLQAAAAELDPEQTARAFLAAAAAGDYARAHDYFSEALKLVQPLAQFSAAATPNRSLFELQSAALTTRTVDEQAELSGSITLLSGAQVPASFKLERETGAWRLTSYQIGSN